MPHVTSTLERQRVCGHGPAMRSGDVRDALLRRLARVEGQVRGLRRMIEEDRYCVDVLMQVAAARAALGRVAKILLDDHVQTCVAEAFDSGDPAEREAKIAELIEVFDRFCRP